MNVAVLALNVENAENNFLRLISWKIGDSTKPKAHFKHFESGLITTTAIVFGKAALKSEVVLANGIFTSVGSEQKFILEIKPGKSFTEKCWIFSFEL